MFNLEGTMGINCPAQFIGRKLRVRVVTTCTQTITIVLKKRYQKLDSDSKLTLP